MPANANEHGGDEEFEDAAEEENPGEDTDYKWGWNGEWPAAVGKLAKYFAEHGNVTTDKQTAEDVFAFLQRANSNLSDLNEFNDASFFLINVPNSTRVRVLYGIRSTTDTPLNPDATRKLRFLTQDLPDDTAKAPGVLELPTSVRDKVTMAVPSDASFDALEVWPTTWNAFLGSALTDAVNVEIMKIVPVPFFVVRDGLEGDLSAQNVYERLTSMDDWEAKPYLRHAVDFVKACTTKYRANQKNPHVSAESLMQVVTPKQRAFARLRTVQLCPDLIVTAPAQGGYNANSPPNTEWLKILAEALKARHAPSGEEKSANDKDGELKEESWAEKLNISDEGLKALLHFCQLEPGEDSLLPPYLLKLGQKRMTKAEKRKVLLRLLQEKKIYQQVDIPYTTDMLQVCVERNMDGGEGVSTYTNCTRGYSPFMMKEMTDEELSSVNEESEAVEKASTTTPSDHKKKGKASVPTTCEDLEKVLMRHANRLHVMTLGRNTLCLDLQKLIAWFQAWPVPARNSVDRKMIASVLWVVLLQTRTLCNTHQKERLMAFRKMMSTVECCSYYSYLGTPAKLSSEPAPKGGGGPKTPIDKTKNGGKKGGGTVNEDGTEEPPKKPRVDKKTGIHDLVREKLGPLLQEAYRKKMKITEICSLAGISTADLVPNNKCGSCTLFGNCFYHKCTRVHKTATEEEAKHVVEKLQPLIRDPSLISGQ
jgi:hypothetical protein